MKTSMDTGASRTNTLASSRALLVVGIILIAINLRPALASVGPLVDQIRAATGLSNSALGFLTTLPLLGFGIISTLTPLVTRRLGVERALVVALFLIAAGTAARALPSTLILFVGTALFGIGIALGNVLLPVLVKRDFPLRSGPMTSLYTSTMSIGAAVAAGVSVPLASVLDWRGALGIWAAPALVALVVWVARSSREAAVRVPTGTGASFREIVRSPLAWKIAMFMGLQSLTFYVILAWLPDLLQDRGLSATEAGWMLALSQATGIIGAIAIPTWAGKLDDQRIIIRTLMCLEALALGGLFLPDQRFVVLWVSLLGAVLGGSFGLALLLLVLRAGDAQSTTALSGMAQSAGYLVAAAGPAIFGLLNDLSQGWTVPLLFLVCALVGKTVVGLGAARPGLV